MQDGKRKERLGLQCKETEKKKLKTKGRKERKEKKVIWLPRLDCGDNIFDNQKFKIFSLINFYVEGLSYIHVLKI